MRAGKLAKLTRRKSALERVQLDLEWAKGRTVSGAPRVSDAARIVRLEQHVRVLERRIAGGK